MLIDVAEARVIARETFLQYCPDKSAYSHDLSIIEKMEELRQAFLKETMEMIDVRAQYGKIDKINLGFMLLSLTDSLSDGYLKIVNHAVS